jgi:hypothetical protein
MAAEETGTAELTPEQKIEEMILGPAEPEPQEEIQDEANAAEIELSQAEQEGQETEDDSEREGDELQAEDEGEAELELFDVEIGDQVYEVPAVIRDQLEQAKDYTQKTQATAEERKALDVVRSDLTQKAQEFEFLESITEETQRSQSIDWQISELRNYMRENIDTLTGNQLEKVRWQMDELNTEKDGIVAALRTKYGEFQQAAEQARKELRDKSTESLKSRLPNWGDEAENQALAYGKEIGFTEDELGLALDPRERQVLWEASEYRRIKAGAGKATAKLARGPKLKPKGRSGQSEATKRKISVRKRLNNATDDKAKADIIGEDMARRMGY